jgi:hypothetical protein
MQVAANLAKDSDYLNKMLASADKIKAEDLVSQASIDNAVALQNRLDAAEKILSQRWHPIQDLLVQGGLVMREAWVNIVESIASAVDWAGKLISKLGEVPGWFQTQMNRGATAFMNLTTTPESRAASETSLGISSNPADIAMLAARQRLASGLQNPANVSAATDQINSIQNKLFADRSKDPAKVTAPDTSAYDRATESVLKYIETTKAASLAVSDAAAEQEKFKVIAQLTAAGMKDGLTPEAAKLKAEMSGLGEKAGAAADALAKARAVSNIEFGRKTALLSQDDVQIATQLKSIYGNDVPAALNSTYAASIRLNNAFQQIGSAIESNLTQGLTDIVSGAKSAGDAFANMGKSIVTAIEQMVIKIMIVQPLMQALQNTIGGGFGSLFGGGGGAHRRDGRHCCIFTPAASSGSEATFSRTVNPAVFAWCAAHAYRRHRRRRGADHRQGAAKGVFTAGQMAAMGRRPGAPGHCQPDRGFQPGRADPAEEQRQWRARPDRVRGLDHCEERRQSWKRHEPGSEPARPAGGEVADGRRLARNAAAAALAGRLFRSRWRWARAISARRRAADHASPHRSCGAAAGGQLRAHLGAARDPARLR